MILQKFWSQWRLKHCTYLADQQQGPWNANVQPLHCNIKLRLTLRGDKVNMLTYTYPHKPPRKIKVVICTDQAESPLYVWFNLVICKFSKSGHTWHRMSLLRPGLIKYIIILHNWGQPQWAYDIIWTSCNHYPNLLMSVAACLASDRLCSSLNPPESQSETKYGQIRHRHSPPPTPPLWVIKWVC